MKKKNQIQISCHEIEIHYKRPVLYNTKKIKSSYDTERVLRKYVNTNRIDYTESFMALFSLMVSNHCI